MASDGAKLLYFTAAYRPGSMAIPVHTELLAALAERGYPSAIVTLAPPGQAAPIAYVPLSSLAKAEFGRIAAGHPCYESYRKYLRRTVEEEFARLLPA